MSIEKMGQAPTTEELTQEELKIISLREDIENRLQELPETEEGIRLREFNQNKLDKESGSEEDASTRVDNLELILATLKEDVKQEAKRLKKEELAA